MTAQRVIALLGRRDEPTDAVEAYCRHLGAALAAHNFQVEVCRVPWNEHGWAASLDALRLQSEAWRGTWVLVQYTALAWSARGFPRRFLQVLRALRKAGAQITVVFHDAEPFGGARLIDRLRRKLQVRVMRNAQALAGHSVFTVAADRLSWLGSGSGKSSFIPVGANLPFPFAPQHHEDLHSPPAIGVFSITGGTAGDRETRDVIAAVRYAAQKLGALRLLVFGRHAELREESLRDGFRDAPVALDVCGVVEESALLRRFADSDVLLFVRGTISSRRGSAIAGIACGLPVIALQGRETAAPVTEAGVILLPENLDKTTLQAQLGEALVRVLSENVLRLQLMQRSRFAQEKYFSWQAIAARYAEFLRQPG
jgi:glycosyltransferase involved in cell wall biosynthesis